MAVPVAVAGMKSDEFFVYLDAELEKLQQQLPDSGCRNHAAGGYDSTKMPMTVSFAPGLNSGQRRLVHMEAKKRGLVSMSVGEGSARCISVYKPGSADAPSEEALLAAQAMRSEKMSREEALSRKLTSLLRHRAVEEGLEITEEGYVRLADILALGHVEADRYTAQEVEELVAGKDDKQRFSMTSIDGERWVRANQGHTIRAVLDSKLLEPVLFAREIPCCVHGTYLNAWQGIMNSGGLSRMGRNHVHFAPRLPEMGEVISGMRPDCEVAVFINASTAMEAGIRFQRSLNGVILTRGNSSGMVPLCHFAKVVRRSDGYLLWPLLHEEFEEQADMQSNAKVVTPCIEKVDVSGDSSDEEVLFRGPFAANAA